MLNKIYWKLFIIKLSIRWCWQINLGDWIWYRGKKYIVSNGVRSGSWRLPYLDNGDDGWVPRVDCRKVWTPKNVIGSFKSGHRFYMGYWYRIWVNEGIKPWMRGCKIWAKGD